VRFGTHPPRLSLMGVACVAAILFGTQTLTLADSWCIFPWLQDVVDDCASTVVSVFVHTLKYAVATRPLLRFFSQFSKLFT